MAVELMPSQTVRLINIEMERSQSAELFILPKPPDGIGIM